MALIQPPAFNVWDFVNDANAPTGLLRVMRPSDVSATIIV